MTRSDVLRGIFCPFVCAFEFRAVVGDLRHTESGKDVAHDETDEMGGFNLILVKDSASAHLVKDFSKKTV